MDFDYKHKYNDSNSKIMLTAILCLSFVIILVIILHIYARCVLRHPRHHAAASSTDIDNHQVIRTTEPLPTKTGLDLMVINSLPSFLYHHIEGQDQTECAVCLSILEEGNMARKLLNCNHIFHLACIDKWLSSQSSCPICRSDAAPRLAPLDRESPLQAVEVTVVTITEGGHNNNDHEHGAKGINEIGSSSSSVLPSSSSLSSSFRSLSSLRKMLGRERALSSRRVHVYGDSDLEGQGLH